MSTETPGSTPVGFSLFTLIGTAIGILFSLIYGFIGLGVLYFVDRQALLWGVIFILAFSLAKTQDILKHQERYSSSSSTTGLMKLITMGINLGYNSAVILAAFVLGSVVETSVGGQLGASLAIVAVVIYAFWEVETRAIGLPVSIGGVMIIMIALVYLLLSGTHHALRQAWIRRHNVVKLLSVSDEQPIFHAARKFS